MTSCPRCGTQNQAAQAACIACGAPLQPAPAPPQAGAMGKQTMLGIGAVTPAAGTPATWPDAPALQQPSPGAVPATWPDAPAMQPAPAGDIKRTMLGMPAMAPPAASPPGGSPKQTMVGIAPPGAIPPGPAPAHGQTMVGFGPQTPAPAYPPPAAPYQQPQPAPPSSAVAPPSSALPSQMKTMLGVARPGIAPLNPGVVKQAPPPPPAPMPAAPRIAPAGNQLRAEDLAVLPGQRRRGGISPVVIAVGIGIVGFVAAAVLVAVLWKGSPPLTATVTLDDQGKEQLQLSCATCKDGTTARLDGRSSAFSAGKATVTVTRPLVVGTNKLSVELVKPGAQSGDRVDLSVPVDYRVRGDLERLSADPPALGVIVEATKDTSVVVDGHALKPGPDGKATYSVDVSRDLTGASPETTPLDRKIPYTITGADGQAHTGEVKLQLGIVPLVVDAPGESIVVDKPTFLLAGRTQKGATVTVGGKGIAVDPSGRFAQLMNVSSVGETTVTVRATAADRAPRLFPIKVKRVESLAAEASHFRANATSSYAAVAKDIDAKHGWAVALEGSVVEARVQDHTSLVLADVKEGCSRAPCLARVIYGGELQLGRGEHLAVFGHVTRAVDGPRTGVKVPEIRADFVIAGKAP